MIRDCGKLAWADQQGHRIELRVTQDEGTPHASPRSGHRSHGTLSSPSGETAPTIKFSTESWPPRSPRNRHSPSFRSAQQTISPRVVASPDHPLRCDRGEGVPRLIDVGCVNGRYFLNVATGGFGAEVAASTPAVAKKVLGGVAYAVTGLLNALSITPYPARLVTPDERWKGNLIVITVSNGRQAGEAFRWAPRRRWMTACSM